MERFQLSLPYSSTLKLRDNQKCKLILNQARKLSVSEWEINKIVELLTEKSWVENGLAFLYDYAGIIDKIRSYLISYSLIIKTISTQSESLSSKERLIENLLNLSFLYVRIHQQISLWRRLQWLPRPIYLEYDGNLFLLVNFLLYTQNNLFSSLTPEHNNLFPTLEMLVQLDEKFKPLLDPELFQTLYEINQKETFLAKVWNQEKNNNLFSKREDLLTLRLPYKDFALHKGTSTLVASLHSDARTDISIFYAKFASKFDQWITTGFKLKLFEVDEYLFKTATSSNLNVTDLNPLIFQLTQQIFTKTIDVSYFLPQLPIPMDSLTSEEEPPFLDSGREEPPLPCLDAQREPETTEIVPPAHDNLPVDETKNTSPESLPQQSIEDFESHEEIHNENEKNINPEPLPRQLIEDFERPEEEEDYEKNMIPEPLPEQSIEDFENQEEDDDENYQEEEQDIPPDDEYSPPPSPPDPQLTKTTSTDYHSEPSVMNSHLRPPMVTIPSTLTFSDRPESPGTVTSEESKVTELHIPPNRPRILSADEAFMTKTPSPTKEYGNFKGTRPRAISEGDALRNNPIQAITHAYHPHSPTKVSNIQHALHQNREKRHRSTLLHSALLRVREKGGPTKEYIAVNKIIVWYRLIAPRKKLLRRIHGKDTADDIIELIIDRVFLQVGFRERKRKQLLRQGAAMRIQRFYRSFIQRAYEEERKIEAEERLKYAQECLDIWRRSVMNSIRIFRYIRYLHRKGIIRRQASQSTTGTMVVPIRKTRNPLMGGVIPPTSSRVRLLYSIRQVTEVYFELFKIYKKFQSHIQFSQSLSTGQASLNNAMLQTRGQNRRLKMYRVVDRASITIQRVCRGYLGRKRIRLLRYRRRCEMRIAYFLFFIVARKKRREKLKIYRSAVRIQTFFRGLYTRLRVLKIVSAGLKLNALWRRHIAYKSLKSQLRRVDRPLTIVMHGLRNISERLVNTGNIRFKISVWWNPLLHIVSKNDFTSILQSKQPQLIYMSNYYRATAAAPPPATTPQSAENIQLLRQQKLLNANPSLSRATLALFNAQVPTPESIASRNSSPPRPAPVITTVNNVIVGAHTPSDPVTTGGGGGGNNSGRPPQRRSRTSTIVIAPERRNNQSTISLGGIREDEEDDDEEEEEGGEGNVEDEDDENGKDNRKLSMKVQKSDSLDKVVEEEEEEEDNEEEGVEVKSKSFVDRMKDVVDEAEEDVGEEEEEDQFDAEMNNSSSKKKNSFLPSPSPSPSPSSFSGSITPQSQQPQVQPAQPKVVLSQRKTRFTQVKTNNSLLSNALSPTSSLNQTVEEPTKEETQAKEPSQELRSTSSGRASVLVGSTGQPKIVLSQRKTQRQSQIIPSRPSSAGSDTSPMNLTPPRNTLPPIDTNRTSMLSRVSLGIPKSPKVSMVRQTINFALHLGNKLKKSSTFGGTMTCDFEDETIKIPGAHGNAAIKFEILDGDRKFGNFSFFLSKEGELMYWGGEYQKDLMIIHQRRAVQFNAHIISTAADRTLKTQAGAPSLAFRVIAGAPLRSRCQWARVLIRGSGPLKRKIQNHEFLSSFSLFDSWKRFYLSLDDSGLYFFENKSTTKPLLVVPIQEFISVDVDISAPVKQSAHKSIVEDINNVILCTSSGDELYIRFPDSGSRMAWQEVFQNAINYVQRSSLAVKKPQGLSWFSQSIMGTLTQANSTLQQLSRKSMVGGAGSSTSHLTNDAKAKSGGSDNSDEAEGGGGGGGGGAGDSHHPGESSSTSNINATGPVPTAILTRSRKPPIFTVPHKSQVH